MAESSIIVGAKNLISLLGKREKRQLFKIMLFAFCSSVFEMITATTIVIFAQVLNKPETATKYLHGVGWNGNFSANQTVLYLALGVGGIYTIKNMIASFEIFFQHFSIQNMNYRFKKKLLERYAHANYSFYLTRNSSQGYAVISSDAELIFTSGLVSMAMMFSEAVIFISLISVIVFIDPKLALFIFMIGFGIGVILVKGIFPLFYRWGKRLQEFSLLGEKNLFQFFHAFKEIVLMNKREVFIDAFHAYSRQKSKIQAIQNVTNILPRMVTELLFVSLFVASIAYFCFEGEGLQKMIGILGGYLYVGFRLLPGLNRIIMQLNTFKSIIPSIERVCKEYNFVTEKENYIDCPEFEFNRNIVIKNVNFHHFGASKMVLQNINFEIKKGECVGIAGETGSGKSTLADLILGLFTPESGTILIDDRYPVNSYQWHTRIGYVQQAIYLTDDTIKANIAFGESVEQIDYKRLEEAIYGAQLEKFIQQQPEGVETIVGERGIRLSGGERQRIAVARALYRNPSVFIFDEATSALDNDTEIRLMETIENLRQNNETIIIIAHRLTTLKKCDKIVVLKQGQIEGILTYDELQNSERVSV